MVTPGPSSPARNRLLATSSGTNLDAFGTSEWGLLAAVATIWGTSFLFVAIGLEAFEPGLITLARVGLGAAALALVPAARRTAIAREDLPRVALLGVIWMGIPLLLFPVAQQWIDSSVAGMVNGAMPLTTAMWSALLLRRLPGRTQAIGLVVGFFGILAISLPELPVGATRTGTAETALGTGLVFVAIVLYGLSANLAVPLQQRYGALPVLLRAQLAALVVIAPFGVAAIGPSRWDPMAALAMLPLGLLGTGLAFVLMATLVGRVGGPRGSVAVYFVPVVAIAAGMLFRAEQVHPLALLGTLLVLAGAWITSRREPLPPAPLGRG
ncbi:DMT family transporter [Egicoccus sp. AB-alg6-2]|uniref:DMT family transporter n=1 Tax=Egicoccus sp. AB-alg6-2 TaxID=3242692 RepID=UPI00359E3F01